MTAQNDYFLKRKKRDELANSVRMYSESEPPEVQFENMWEVVSRLTGKTLQEAQPDFSEFSPSDRMYPSMMAPDVKKRWDMKNLEWENQKEKYRLIKRMVRAQFLLENKDLPLARDLAKTAYGKELLSEAAQSEFMDSESNRAFGLHGTSQGVSDRSFDAVNNLANNAVELFGRASILGTLFPEKKVLETFYIWQANEGACKSCTSKNGEISKTPTMVRPHPNCKCRQVKCEICERVTRWEFVKNVKTLGYKYLSVFFAGALGTAYWRRSYVAEEQRVREKVQECDSLTKILSRTVETRKSNKTDTVQTKAYKIFTGGNIEYGDRAWTLHPWTGAKVEIHIN